MNILGDRVLVRPHHHEPPKTESGIQLADYGYYPEVSGTVVERGTGRLAEDGTPLGNCVSIGDVVIFAAESGHDVVVAGERFIVLREDDLLAVLN